MRKLFTEGLRNEPQKQTEIGPIPESWEVNQLIETVEFIDYGVSQAIPKTPTTGGVKIVSTADIDKHGNLLYWKIRRIIVPEKTVNRLVLKDGDVLFNWRNSAELIGKSTIFEEQDELAHLCVVHIENLRRRKEVPQLLPQATDESLPGGGCVCETGSPGCKSSELQQERDIDPQDSISALQINRSKLPTLSVVLRKKSEATSTKNAHLKIFSAPFFTD